MKYHPGGEEHTRHMLRLGGLLPPARILDMGAGAGEAVAIAREKGFEAMGIDLVPRGDGVERGDYLHSALKDGSFEGILSQCSFYVSGNAGSAMKEAARLLVPGGVLMLSDVYPIEEDPADFAREVGLTVEYEEDMTPLWKRYFIQAIWDEEDICIPTGRKYRYKILIARKSGESL